VFTHLIALGSLYLAAGLASEAPLSLLAVPAAIALDQFAYKNHSSPRLIKPLKLKAINWHSAVTAMMFLAFFTAGVGVHGTENMLFA
jgi:hypothetical protein